MRSKTAILVDFDNIFLSLWELDREVALRCANGIGNVLDALAAHHLVDAPRQWLVAKCYLNPAGYVWTGPDRSERLFFSRFRPELVRAGFEVVDCPALTRHGKNAADIRIAIDILDLLSHRTRFDEFVLASADADFTPLLQRIRAEDRRITLVSPGFPASAYTAIADQVIDFDAIVDILHGEPAGQPSDAPRTDPGAPAPSEQARFAAFITARYREARGPLNLSALSLEAAALCPGAKTSEWFGQRSFSAAVQALELPNLQLSQHFMWDGTRHEPPATPGAQAEALDLPEPVALLTRALDLPALDQRDWPPLFDALAAFAAQQPFSLTEATRWTRDALAQHGFRIDRGTIGYVIRGCQFGGVRMDASPPPPADVLAEAFYHAVLDRAASTGLALSPEAEEVIADWFGLAPLAETDEAEAGDAETDEPPVT